MSGGDADGWARSSTCSRPPLWGLGGQPWRQVLSPEASGWISQPPHRRQLLWDGTRSSPRLGLAKNTLPPDDLGLTGYTAWPTYPHTRFTGDAGPHHTHPGHCCSAPELLHGEDLTAHKAVPRDLPRVTRPTSDKHRLTPEWDSGPTPRLPAKPRQRCPLETTDLPRPDSAGEAAMPADAPEKMECLSRKK